jgi:uncharacterized OsmC-like protein
MSSTEKIKKAFDRVVKTFTAKPSLGLGSRRSKARLVDGLTCEITEGDWTFTADMPEAAGGNASAPTPGVYGRAALSSCLAICYRMWASKKGVAIDAIEVEVEADFDDGGLFGTSDVRPGYTEIRYTVTIETDEPEKKIIALLDEADKHSPYLDVFANKQPCVRTAKIISPKLN